MADKYNFAQMGKFIATAEQDGRVTLNALVVAELVEPTDNIRDDLRLVMLAQANAYPRLVEAMRSQIADLEAVYDAAKSKKSGVEITLGMFRRLNTARALLAELGE